jgi:NAD-dependent dihydropyrimidine dehydrogenase PreA subunit
MDLEPAKLRFMQRAREMGLGDFEKGTIEVIGELAAIPGFKLPPLGGEAIAGSEAVREFMHSRTLLRPKADPEKCTACGTCVEQCSVSALSMEDDLPVVDADTCITCFCCQEICPEKAITLQLP